MYCFFFGGVQRESADKCFCSLNAKPCNFQFTMNSSRERIEFLDLMITYEGTSFLTSAFFKKVGVNRYLDNSSRQYKTMALFSILIY